MRLLKVIGSDTDNFSCPRCLSHDRERHLLLYLQRLDLLGKMKDATILHFAPERHLSRIIAGIEPARYIRADLFPNEPGIQRIDMMHIPYDSNTFDFVIANHVLEHVPNDLQCLSELERVLKPGGMAVLQTPYSSILTGTLCDSGINSDELRLQCYGQEDHVRLFGADIFDRISGVGFKSCVVSHSDVLPDIAAATYGVNQAEPFFLFEKQ